MPSPSVYTVCPIILDLVEKLSCLIYLKRIMSVLPHHPTTHKGLDFFLLLAMFVSFPSVYPVFLPVFVICHFIIFCLSVFYWLSFLLFDIFIVYLSLVICLFVFMPFSI